MEPLLSIREQIIATQQAREDEQGIARQRIIDGNLQERKKLMRPRMMLNMSREMFEEKRKIGTSNSAKNK